MLDCIGTNEKLLTITFFVLSKFNKTITSRELSEVFDMNRRTASRLLNTIFECQRNVNGLRVERAFIDNGTGTCNLIEYTFEYKQ